MLKNYSDTEFSLGSKERHADSHEVLQTVYGALPELFKDQQL